MESRTQFMIVLLVSLGILAAAEPPTAGKSVILTLRNSRGEIVWNRELKEGGLLNVIAVERFVVEKGEHFSISGDRKIPWLIKVTGNEPSLIHGKIETNSGTIPIINPHGVVIGGDAQVIFNDQLPDQQPETNQAEHAER